MTIAKFVLGESLIDITWPSGRCESYHYVWLRDNVATPDNLDAMTGERRVDFHLLPEDPRPSSVRLSEAGDLVVRWPDLDGEAVYSAQWLEDNAYSAAARAERSALIPGPKPWNFRSKAEAPGFDFAAVLESPEAESAFLKAFRAYSIAFLRGAPAEPGVVEQLTRRLGYTREVAFGFIREVRSAPTYDNVAFTSHRVPPHIDAVNYAWPYDVQFLHCITNHAEGGDSWVVDGYALAERLRQRDPEAFDVLARVPVDYKIGARSFDVRYAAPVIELDKDGAVRYLRFSNQQRRVLCVPHGDVEPFYRAYRKLSAMVNDPDNHLAFRFEPGDVLMFNNHRALHARGEFNPQTGARHLQLGTTDIDMVDSRIRLLSGMKEPVQVAVSQ